MFTTKITISIGLYFSIGGPAWQHAYMLSLKRGERVWVKVVDGKEVTLRFWGLKGAMILVTNDDEFQKLQSGKPALWPVAFHPEDVRALESEPDEGR